MTLDQSHTPPPALQPQPVGVRSDDVLAQRLSHQGDLAARPGSGRLDGQQVNARGGVCALVGNPVPESGATRRCVIPGRQLAHLQNADDLAGHSVNHHANIAVRVHPKGNGNAPVEGIGISMSTYCGKKCTGG